MTLCELIKNLEHIVAEHGDREVLSINLCDSQRLIELFLEYKDSYDIEKIQHYLIR